VSFSPALPVHLPSTNSSFFQGESPAWPGAICARTGRTQNNTAPRITLVRIVISFHADSRIVPERSRNGRQTERLDLVFPQVMQEPGGEKDLIRYIRQAVFA
jgi:hypothetical protein